MDQEKMMILLCKVSSYLQKTDSKKDQTQKSYLISLTHSSIMESYGPEGPQGVAFDELMAEFVTRSINYNASLAMSELSSGPDNDACDQLLRQQVSSDTEFAEWLEWLWLRLALSSE